MPPPLVEAGPAPRLTAAEEARTLVAATNVAALATLTTEGDPWASLITYGTLDDGAPVLCLSRLAAHGRNLAADPRTSMIITRPIARLILSQRHASRSPAAPNGHRTPPRWPPPAPHTSPLSRHRTPTSTSPISHSGSCASIASAGSAATAAWTPHRGRPTPRRNLIPSQPPPPQQLRTSTRITETRCSRSRRPSAATPMRHSPDAPGSIAAASISPLTPPGGGHPPASRSPPRLQKARNSAPRPSNSPVEPAPLSTPRSASRRRNPPRPPGIQARIRRPVGIRKPIAARLTSALIHPYSPWA